MGRSEDRRRGPVGRGARRGGVRRGVGEGVGGVVGGTNPTGSFTTKTCARAEKTVSHGAAGPRGQSGVPHAPLRGPSE